MKRTAKAVVALLAALAAYVAIGTPAVADSGCTNPNDPLCDQHSLTADQQRGEFHGLIMVPGHPGVLDKAASAGTQPGCGDCEWTLILACLYNVPSSGHVDSCGNAATPAGCGKGQTLYRLYLTTDAVRNALVDTICLGGPGDVVPVGQQAAADVQRYLKDVVPPDAGITVQPPNGALAGLPAYFTIQPPQPPPAPFGNGRVTESITIQAQDYLWNWGDGSTSGWTTDTGGPYPDGTLTHTYVHAGHVTGSVTTRWRGTYTVTVGGRTLGPYDATGTVSKTQPFQLVVLSQHSHLVSR